jgi:hypothetical protein
LLALVFVGPVTWAATEPRIVSMEHRGEHCVIRVSVPPGVARVVIEACLREDLRAWVPKATARVAPHETELTFSLVSDARMELFRVRSETSDPLPASWYTGDTRFLAEPLQDPLGWRPGLTDVTPSAPGRAEGLGVVDSGILRVEGDTLYFFNPLRGLQVFDLAAPEGVRLRGTLSLPGQGEQMYLAGKDHVVVLTHDPCREWGVDAETALWVIDTGVTPLAEKVRLPLKGRMVESRWVGTAFYVATETWEPVNDGSGSWRAGTQVASFDFASPTAPVARGTLWFPGAGNVVAATDSFLLVAIAEDSPAWPWRSELEVLDISSLDGTVATWVRIPLPGRLRDRSSIDLVDDVLRLVVEALETPDTQRWVTALESYRLSDPRSMSPLPVALLDRLELARGERLASIRFDGARGYFATFDPTEPLWMIDLSNPFDLRIGGDVGVPGGSTVLRPLGDRLLTLGVDQALGSQVVVQLLDVSDPLRPERLAHVALGENAAGSSGGAELRALQVLAEEGLVMVPVSKVNPSGTAHGVQLLDLGRHNLSQRGFLNLDGWTPERSVVHRDRLLMVSARSLASADIGNRDEPLTTPPLELTYPVDRVLVVGDHLLEFHASTIRVRRLDGTGAWTSVDVGDLPVLGALAKGNMIHLLQGRGVEMAWNYDAATSTWTGRTNRQGRLLASSWDASTLPALIKVGEGDRPTSVTWIGDAEGRWLRDHELLWSSTTELRGGWELGGEHGTAEEVAMEGLAVVGGGPWQPWQGTRARHLTAVDVSHGSSPSIRSELVLGGNSGSVGVIAQAGSMVFSSRRRMEPEVVGMEEVSELAWFPGVPELEITSAFGAEGGVGGGFWARNEAEWRSVPEGHAIVRWWTRYELDVVDYRGGIDHPVVRPPVAIPGVLEGVTPDGALLVTTGWGRREDGSPVATLDVSAYDGVSAHRVDSVRIADGTKSETYAVAVRGESVFLARGGWGGDAQQSLGKWWVGEDGKWREGSVVHLGMVPGDLRWKGESLLARNGGELAWFRLGERAELEPVPVTRAPACFSGDLGRADGDAVRGIWLPLGERGAYRIGP